MKKVLAVVLCVAMVLAMAACTRSEPVEQTVPVGEDKEYTVSVTSLGGMALPEIEVYIYEDDSCTELVSFAQTDENGQASFTMPQKDGYAIRLESVPQGYRYEDIYRFDGTAAAITLTSALIEGENLSGASLGVGDVMYDFEVALPDGSVIKLSEMLAQKKAVMLNFFFTTCGPCANEFPYMQQAYEEYEAMGIIALDPLEDNTAVATYQASMGLTFPMAACNPGWSQTFGISGYPTSIVIDRYGVICLVEVGGITSLRPFSAMFEHFTADLYEQKLYGSVSELITTVKPTFTMASSEEVAEILGAEALAVTFRPETEGESAEYAWPFIETEKAGVRCLKASNQSIDGSYAILYADITLQQGQAVAFDYLASTEKGCDVLYVIVDGQDVFAISGWDAEEVWKTCYPWVALESGEHEVALCYLKDGDSAEADDTVYIANLRTVAADAIDAPTYIPREAATETADGYTYVDFTLGSDGYYHVGSPDGPLLLANLMNYSQFSEEQTVWDIVYNSDIQIEGKSFYDTMVHYFSYASNSNGGLTPVDEELMGYLRIVDEHFGFHEDDPNEWIKCCTYYAAYGTDTQLQNPSGGLSTFSAFEAKLGVGVESNYFYYDRPIMPRGLLARFTPSRSGVYRITSHTDSVNGVDAWIFEEDRENPYTYAADQRMQPDVLNCYMYYYMEAGKNYYIDIAFWDIYEVGKITYDIEYMGASMKLFRLASPGFFTYDTNATGEHMYDVIAGGIDVVLGEDGYYYEDLGGGQRGSLLYCDFTGITGIFSDAIATVQACDAEGKLLYDAQGQPVMRKGLIDKGGFDFSKTENDQYILSILEMYDGDAQAAKEYLRATWGEDFDANAESYQLDDVLAGRYHGRGQDYTDEIAAFLDDMITTGPEERRGCVPVNQELAQLLQLLMDKFTFSDVENSWSKLCYYYDYLGPQG